MRRLRLNTASKPSSTSCNCYCDVSMSVELLMNLFPSDRTPVDLGEFAGNFLLVKERAEGGVHQPPRRTLGRPPAFAWEAFHVGVADLIRKRSNASEKRGSNSATGELV